MKYIKSMLALIYTMVVPITVFAEQTAPENAAERISWAVKNSGAMPKFMVISLVLLAAMTVITILVAKMKGADNNA